MSNRREYGMVVNWKVWLKAYEDCAKFIEGKKRRGVYWECLPYSVLECLMLSASQWHRDRGERRGQGSWALCEHFGGRCYRCPLTTSSVCTHLRRDFMEEPLASERNKIGDRIFDIIIKKYVSLYMSSSPEEEDVR